MRRNASILLLGTAALAVAAPRAAAQAASIRVCVGPDRVLRVAPQEPCVTGRIIALAPAGSENIVDNQQRDAKKIAELQQRVSVLEGQLAAARTTQEKELADARTEMGNMVRRVKAPFIVTDGAGRPLFVVGETGRTVELRNQSGQHVVVVGADADGGYLRTQDPSGGTQAVIGVKTATPQFVLHIGGRRTGAFYAKSDGLPLLQLFTMSGLEALTLTIGNSGGGKIQLNNAQGLVRVEAGTNMDDLGVVRAGPRWNCGGKMGLVATDCIVGHP